MAVTLPKLFPSTYFLTTWILKYSPKSLIEKGASEYSVGIWLTSEERANLIRRAGTSAAGVEGSSLADSSPALAQQGLTVRGSSSLILIHVTDRLSDPLGVDQEATESTN